MTDKEKLNHLEELLDIEKDTLDEDAVLEQIEQWDSIAVIALIAMLDDMYGKVISPADVKGFKNVRDILNEMK